MRGDIAPVSVTEAGQHRPSIVFRGVDRLGHERIPSICTDHDPRLFRDLRPTLWATANSSHSTSRRSQPSYREPLSHFGAGLGGGLQQELVQHRPARRAHLSNPVERRRVAGQLELAQIQPDRADDRTVRRQHAVKQPPALEARDPGRPDEMGRNGIARESRPIDEQNAQASLRQQHGGRRPGAPCANHNRVVHRSPPVVEVADRGRFALGLQPYRPSAGSTVIRSSLPWSTVVVYKNEPKKKTGISRLTLELNFTRAGTTLSI